MPQPERFVPDTYRAAGSAGMTLGILLVVYGVVLSLPIVVLGTMADQTPWRTILTALAFNLLPVGVGIGTLTISGYVSAGRTWAVGVLLGFACFTTIAMVAMALRATVWSMSGGPGACYVCGAHTVLFVAGAAASAMSARALQYREDARDLDRRGFAPVLPATPINPPAETADSADAADPAEDGDPPPVR
jgi:hypothetical protein